MTERRGINGFGTLVDPPETYSSISTVGRRAPSFWVEARTYSFRFMFGKLAFEERTDINDSKLKRNLPKGTELNSSPGLQRSTE